MSSPINTIIRRSMLLENGCWHWTGALNDGGYGNIKTDAGTRRTHRVAYESLIGPIPEGLTLDHLCRNRACCNPAHLDPVTRGENVLRGDTIPARRAAQTHCRSGHAFTSQNTYVDKLGRRVCRECRSIYNRAYIRPSRRAEQTTVLKIEQADAT